MSDTTVDTGRTKVKSKTHQLAKNYWEDSPSTEEQITAYREYQQGYIKDTAKGLGEKFEEDTYQVNTTVKLPYGESLKIMAVAGKEVNGVSENTIICIPKASQINFKSLSDALLDELPEL